MLFPALGLPGAPAVKLRGRALRRRAGPRLLRQIAFCYGPGLWLQAIGNRAAPFSYPAPLAFSVLGSCVRSARAAITFAG